MTFVFLFPSSVYVVLLQKSNWICTALSSSCGKLKKKYNPFFSIRLWLKALKVIIPVAAAAASPPPPLPPPSSYSSFSSFYDREKDANPHICMVDKTKLLFLPDQKMGAFSLHSALKTLIPVQSRWKSRMEQTNLFSFQKMCDPHFVPIGMRSWILVSAFC